MSHLVFVETSGSGVHAIDYAKRVGHTVTFLYSGRYGFTAPPRQRMLARALADRTAEFGPGERPVDLLAALRVAGTDPAEVDAVLSTLAFGAPPAAALAAEIGVRGTPPAAVELARDKGRCRQVLRDAGIPSLGFAVVATAEEAVSSAAEIGYPVIVKPVLGIGKAATTIARSAEEVRAHFAGLDAELQTLADGMSEHFDGRFILEELAVGDLYSVEVAADGHTFVPLVAAARKTGLENPILEMGCTVPSGLGPADEAALGAYTVDVCRALGLNLGVFHLEVMHTAGGFRLIEANPRIAGGGLPETINAATGADIFGVLVDLFAGAPAPSRPLPIIGAASHSLLAAAAPGKLQADLPPEWFAEFRDRVHSGWVRVGAGSRLKAMRGNFDTFGMIRTLEDDAEQAEALCSQVKDDIARALGITLVGEALPNPPRVRAAPGGVR